MVIARQSGFDIDPAEISPALKPHQRDAVIWALKGGRRALFEKFGLGKTVQELEFCKQVILHEGGKGLIVVPLGVRQEFMRDAEQLLKMNPPKYITHQSEAINDNEIYLTNYERVRDGDIDPKQFTVVALDEAAVLRNFGSKTSQVFITKFHGIKYKLVATATPSPNRFKELVHYSGFLEVASSTSIFQRFFQRNSTKAHEPTLFEHKKEEFWLWVSSWALYLSSPADLGYDAKGYDLPDLEVRTHVVKDAYGKAVDKDGQVKLMNDAATSLQEAAKEKNQSILARVQKAKQIIDSSPKDHFVIWHDLEAERHEIKREIKGVVDIYGSMDYEEREKRVIDFSDGSVRLFATKKSLSGCGCNFQRFCHRAIFIGIDYQFHDFIQAVHRIYRYLQTEKVIVDIIYTESEEPIYKELLEKWKRHEEMEIRMGEIVKKYGLRHRDQMKRMERSIGVVRIEKNGKRWKAVNNDCVEEVKSMEDNSIDLIHTSIPFSNQFEYTPSYNDFGHNESTNKFFEQMDYLSPELLRVLKPGRVYACHVKDRTLYGNVTGLGMTTIEPFHAMCISHYMKHGFQYFGMITVVTDVVRENNQTYRLGWTEQCKDGTKMGVGMPEYVLLFRKLPTDTSKAYADVRVTKERNEYSLVRWQLDAHAFWRSSGDRYMTGKELSRLSQGGIQRKFRDFCNHHIYDYEEHVKLGEDMAKNNAKSISKTFMTIPPSSVCSDVWDDITRIKTLNTTQSQRKQTMHVCPLQIDIVERIIRRYSNEDELVFDPFGGIGTVPLTAIKMGRRGIMTELNPDYYRDAVGYLQAEESDIMDNFSLFDVI